MLRESGRPVSAPPARKHAATLLRTGPWSGPIRRIPPVVRAFVASARRISIGWKAQEVRCPSPGVDIAPNTAPACHRGGETGLSAWMGLTLDIAPNTLP